MEDINIRKRGDFLNIIEKHINLNVSQPNDFELVCAMQNTQDSLKIIAKLYDANVPYIMDNTVSHVMLQGVSPCGMAILKEITEYTSTTASFLLSDNMLAVDGDLKLSIVITANSENSDNASKQIISTFPFTIRVVHAPVGKIQESEFDSVIKYVLKTEEYAKEAKVHNTFSESYAVGGTGIRENESIDNSKFYYEQSKSISESISGALRPMGTINFSSLPPLSSVSNGDMYNISDEFTTTDDFKEGNGNIIPAGSNIYKTADEKWDVLAGTPVTGIKGNAESTYRKGNVNITKDNIGLENVDNTSDSNKNVASADKLNLPRVTKNASYQPGMHRLVFEEFSKESTNIPSANWYHIFTGQGADANYNTQLALGMSTEDICYRNRTGGIWGNWLKLMHSGNIGNYAMPKSGGTFTGAVGVGGKVKLWTDGEGGNIQINSPDSYNKEWQIDAFNGNLRIYQSDKSTNSNYFPFNLTKDTLVANNITANGAITGNLTGNASTATALTTSAGSSTHPVYFSSGKPVACTYTLEKSVPSNAVFTDTNTWRGIQNNLTSTSTTESLSANQGRLLANGSARDNSKLPLTGGTLNGHLYLSKNYTLYMGLPSNGNQIPLLSSSEGDTFYLGRGSWENEVGRVYVMGRLLNLVSKGNIVVKSGTNNCFMSETDNSTYLGSSTYKWKAVYAVTGTIQTSDRNAKNSIDALDEAFISKFILDLKPVKYKLNESDSDRYHWGLISQDVEETMKKLEIDSKEFAGFIKSPKTIINEDGEETTIAGEYSYSLRYDEFIAPLILMAQNNKRHIDELEKAAAQNRKEISDLKALFQELVTDAK